VTGAVHSAARTWEAVLSATRCVYAQPPPVGAGKAEDAPTSAEMALTTMMSFVCGVKLVEVSVPDVVTVCKLE